MPGQKIPERLPVGPFGVLGIDGIEHEGEQGSKVVVRGTKL